MTDHRTVSEQVKSGFRIAGLLVLVFSTFMALAATLSYLTGGADHSKGNHPLAAILVLVSLTATMFLTTQYWAKWLVAVLAYGFLRMLGPLMFKAVWNNLFKEISMAELLTWCLYLLAALALTARHIERPPVGAEKFGLVAFVICAALGLVQEALTPLLVGLGSPGSSRDSWTAPVLPEEACSDQTSNARGHRGLLLVVRLRRSASV